MKALVAALLFATAACSNSTPPSPPTVEPPAGGVTVTGRERFGWDQAAGDPAELATIRYAAYVDGNRSELAGVTCDTAATSAGFPCSAPLPPMAAGGHTLELTAFVDSGSILESAKSAALRLTVTGILSVVAPIDTVGGARPRSVDGSPVPVDRWPAAATRVVDGLQRPTDIAVVADGRVLVAEPTGRVRIVVDGAIASEPAIVLAKRAGDQDAVLALAADPQFARTHFVFAVLTTASQSGGRSFALVRFREAGNTLGDRITLLDEVPASPTPHASLRFGPDGKLYAAFDAGVDGRAVPASSPNAKVLRLNPDGTTPADQPGGSPIFANNVESPRGIAWPGGARRPWIADEQRVGDMAWPISPAAIAITRDQLYVGSDAGLVRGVVDGRQTDRMTGMATVFDGVQVRALTTAPDGAIWFATDRALGVLQAR